MLFEMPKKAIAHFKKNDPILHDYIINSPVPIREINPNHFDELVRSIIYQQVSLKAGDTVYSRLQNLTEITPEMITSIDRDTLQSIGITYRKVDYLKNLSEKTITKEVKFDTINDLSNEEIIEMITSVKGLGVWSVEMFLMFSLGRLDISSYSDLAIKRGIQKLYNLDEFPTKQQFKEYTTTWSPYNTIASFYLWEASK